LVVFGGEFGKLSNCFVVEEGEMVMYHVFVYGAARPFYNVWKVKYYSHVPATLEGYEMYVIGAYPTIVQGRGTVLGDLVSVDDKGLEVLDEVEGWVGERIVVSVEVVGGVSEALTYVASAMNLGSRAKVPTGDWSDAW
jgi:gamma-glutamylcyclotransferase (GGCT)/AIG2-like uncharacterized protein YtfP